MIYRPYTQNGGVPPSGNVSNVKQSPGQPQSPLLSSFISRLPFAYQIIDSMVRNNHKVLYFQESSNTERSNARRPISLHESTRSTSIQLRQSWFFFN